MESPRGIERMKRWEVTDVSGLLILKQPRTSRAFLNQLEHMLKVTCALCHPKVIAAL